MDVVTRLGFLGLGQMGAPLAERLLGPGTELFVHDPRPEAMAPFVARGARACHSPREVADAATIVLACLPGGTVSEAAALGHDGVAEGKAVRHYVEMSTIGRPAMERIAAGLAAKGILPLDAPISGGLAGARAGTLAIMLAGPGEAVAALQPVLARMGRELFVLGERPGQGQVAKLVNNLLAASNLVTVFEAMSLGTKAGLDPMALAAVVNAGTGRSFVTSDMLPVAISRRFDFGATVTVMDKDVALGLEEARALGVPMWAIEQVGRVWRFAASHGMAASDITELVRLMEGWAGTEIGRPTAPHDSRDA
ncbi:NAD(P)-dependent oxidoreductase [Belnapia sp. T6]|uniref:NAD(P)-dependent oxidoreductase n=1 Tax=Belnapia mucosa TaxID=2804532 RepID=A0ABS1VBQ3_9PROT|nr:NAD(P)-dependent oxidoreductase [Belnapia mucosa]MBL6459063.1 NAD(P)-dependent oxidoreductase [Belnapia mucosa]